MTTMTLNSTEFNITGYNRYTTIDENGARSNANVSFPNNSQYNSLARLGEIDSIVIKIDGETVYSLIDISARISTISESLSDHGVGMNAQIAFEIVTE